MGRLPIMCEHTMTKSATQFSVHENPITVSRRGYPYVVVLQSAVVANARDTIVAPLVLRTGITAITGRLTPAVKFAANDYVVIIPALANIHTRDLGEAIGSLAEWRGSLLAGIDYLFFGI